MPGSDDTPRAEQDTTAELEDLRRQLREAEETLAAIRYGKADALLLETDDGLRVYTLYGADYTYRMVIETMLEGAVMLGGDGLITYCNQAFADLVRAPLEQVMGSTFDFWCQPDDRSTLRRLLESAAVHGSELTLRRTDGGSVCVLATANKLSTGRRSTVCLVVTDITVQHRQYLQLQAEEQLARSILDQAGDGIVVCDADGYISRASREANRIAGGHTLGRPFDTIFPLVGCDPMAAPAPALWREQQVERMELRLLRPDGETLNLLVSVAPLPITAHGLPGSVVTLTDITAQRRLEHKLRHA